MVKFVLYISSIINLNWVIEENIEEKKIYEFEMVVFILSNMFFFWRIRGIKF